MRELKISTMSENVNINFISNYFCLNLSEFLSLFFCFMTILFLILKLFFVFSFPPQWQWENTKLIKPQILLWKSKQMLNLFISLVSSSNLYLYFFELCRRPSHTSTHIYIQFSTSLEEQETRWFLIHKAFYSKTSYHISINILLLFWEKKGALLKIFIILSFFITLDKQLTVLVKQSVSKAKERENFY